MKKLGQYKEKREALAANQKLRAPPYSKYNHKSNKTYREDYSQEDHSNHAI